PGALDGISKCFIGADTVKSSDVIWYMFDHQEEHFEKLGVDFPNLWGRRLQLIDCQNLFCEISKYSRAAFPDYTAVARGTCIKTNYDPSGPRVGQGRGGRQAITFEVLVHTWGGR